MLTAGRSVSPDGWLLIATRAVRNFGYGYLSVILGLYLAALGLDAAQIGAVFAASLAGGAAMTVLVAVVADRVGRRVMLRLSAILMAIAGIAFTASDQIAVLLVAAVVGTISPSAGEVGPFLGLEQAALPQTTLDRHRTTLFAWYNLAGSLASALGALVAGLPVLLGLSDLAGYRWLVWGYAATGLLLWLLFSRLSAAIEVSGNTGLQGPLPRRWLGVHRSGGLLARLAVLFALDSFAGGFIVQGLVAYWLHLRFSAEPAQLGAIFFGTNLLAAFSYLVAARMARRIGLINTMVVTHLPSNVLLLLVPLMPTLGSAVAVLLLRNALAQMDVPTRQSYIVAVVDPDERSAAAGLTAAVRNVAHAVAPGLAGATLAVPALGLPFLIAGGLKIVYDLSLFFMFRHIRPPEEA